MASLGIRNINNLYNVNNKKIQSKLSFSLGDKFIGSIIQEKANGEVIIKLPEGWQFTAFLENPAEVIEKGFLKLQVQDFSEGKLKLKILSQHEDISSKDIDKIKNLLRELNIGFNKGEYELLQKMIKFKLPLTKENISKVKTLFDFKNETLNEDDKIEQFIEKYILTKSNINKDDKTKIKAMLKSFYRELSTIDIEDVLCLIENEVDLTGENIKSYKNIFKENGSVYKHIISLNDDIVKVVDETINDKIFKFKGILMEQKNNIKYIINTLENKEVEFSSLVDRSKLHKMLPVITKAIESDRIDTLSIETKEFLTLQKDFIEILNKYEGLDNSIPEKTKALSNNLYRAQNILVDVLDIQNNNVEQVDEMNINEFFGKSLELQKNNIKLITANLIQYNEESNNGNLYNKLQEIPKLIEQCMNNFKDEDFKSNLIKVNNKSNNALLEVIESVNKTSDSIIKVLDENILEVQNTNNKSQPIDIKSIIKEFSNIYKETMNVLNEAGNIDNKVVWEIRDLKIELRDLAKSLSQIINKSVSKETKDIVIEDINNKSEYLKNIIKEVIQNKHSSNPEIYDKIVDKIMSRINDFKVFNTFSNSYYYYDLPIKVNKREYECKFVIKDERKKGKKIDSQNVKIAVSVKTMNLDIIDSYINIKNSNMNIDIKSEEKWISVLQMNKQNLLQTLKILGYNVNVNIFVKTSEMDLVTTREFFNDDNLNSIDITV